MVASHPRRSCYWARVWEKLRRYEERSWQADSHITVRQSVSYNTVTDNTSQLIRPSLIIHAPNSYQEQLVRSIKSNLSNAQNSHPLAPFILVSLPLCFPFRRLKEGNKQTNKVAPSSPPPPRYQKKTLSFVPSFVSLSPHFQPPSAERNPKTTKRHIKPNQTNPAQQFMIPPLRSKPKLQPTYIYFPHLHLFVHSNTA